MVVGVKPISESIRHGISELKKVLSTFWAEALVVPAAKIKPGRSKEAMRRIAKPYAGLRGSRSYSVDGTFL